jgi:hypothetical protein
VLTGNPPFDFTFISLKDSCISGDWISDFYCGYIFAITCRQMIALRHLRKLAPGTKLLESQILGCSMVMGEGHSLQQAAGVTGSVYDVGVATNIKFHDGMVPRADKEKILDQKGVVVWFTGQYISVLCTQVVNQLCTFWPTCCILPSLLLLPIHHNHF